MAGHEPGDRGVVGPDVTTEGHEHDVGAAGGFDLTRGEDALRVGEQDYLHQCRRIIGRPAAVIVVIGCIEH